MDSRRSLLRTVTGLVTGGAAVFGTAESAAARSGDTATARSETRNRGAATVTLEANRTAIRSAGRPEMLTPVVETLERRFDGVSLADFASATGTGHIAGGDLVAGTVVANGSIDADAVRSSLRRRGFAAVGDRNGVDRYATPDGPFAVGVADSRLVVGYDGRQTGGPSAGRTDGRSLHANGLARVDTVVQRSNRAAAVRGPASASSGSPATAARTVLEDGSENGDLTVTAAPDAGTRAQIRSVLADGRRSRSLAPILEHTASLGVSVSVEPDENGWSELTYGLVGDEELSVTTVREGLEGLATDADGIGSVHVEQRGPGIAVNCDVATGALLEAQLAAVGLEGAFDGHSIVGR
ncbi:hypothetical protein [Halopiger aswanensis]|uniref:Uncharacterized protein n=1 Tax=Halopiger aswanensis TaxID=148449 RepID=A0A419WS34_9EURY|nr:hypothetical protein [Halopiger aswanensis]RKD98294.1 hypothetical protein ATJ93_1300 [Halopiger aswanensis]